MNKIAYLVSCYPDFSHTFIQREVEALQRRGVHIAVASVNPSPLPHDLDVFVVKKQGVFVLACSLLRTCGTSPLLFLRGLLLGVRLARWDLQKQLRSLCYFVEAISLGRWMQSIGRTHLHVHFSNAAATVAMITAKVFQIPYSLSLHGMHIFLHGRREYLPEKIASAQFIRCISHSTASRVFLHTHSPFQIKPKVVRLGVDPSFFHPEKKRTYQREELSLLTVGRLAPEKGYPVLLAAMAQIKHLPFQLRIVGDGPLRKQIQQEADRLGLQEKLRWEGALTQKEVLERYKQADLFVLPSFTEGVPVSLMEAMAMEIPCISTWVGGIPELIENHVSGLLVPPGSPDALAKALKYLLSHPQAREQLGRSGRKKVETEYNVDANTKKLKHLFEEFL